MCFIFMEVCDIEYSLLLVRDYIDIYKTLSSLSCECATVFSTADDVQRSLLIDWISEICSVYTLCIDTFSTAVYLLDKMTAIKRFPASRLQLLAGTCLWIASIYEETAVPAISDLVFLCDGLYTRNEFIQMQIDVLNTINFRIGRKTPRFSIMLKTYDGNPSDDFFEAIDSILSITFYIRRLTFAPPDVVADAVISVVVNGLTLGDEDTPAKCDIVMECQKRFI